MGLYVHSLLEIPFEAKRNYYVYLLDYGWYEPLGEALAQNFDQMAEIASKNSAVVIRSAGRGIHFQDEVFSWHGINGEDDGNILPAILITDRHPKEFKESYNYRYNREDQNFRIILFPLKQHCVNTTEVIKYVNSIFIDIIEKRDLSNFKVAKEMKKGLGRALVDGLLLEPNVAGIGYNLNSLINFFRKKNLNS